jgi:peptidoglycan-associated lipoprotein
VVTSVRGPENSTTTSLPDTLLFPFNSSTLIPSADTLLQPIARRARSQHQLVSITGYASPDGGTTAYNLALSERRANAVRNRLTALGLPADQITQVTGAGTAGQSPDVCLVHGQLDEAMCAQLRRVVIVLSPAAVTS